MTASRSLSSSSPLPLVGAIACVMLLLVGITLAIVGFTELHLYGLGHALNDQAAYVDAARRVLAFGAVDSGAIYPSTLLQEADRQFLYMPGHPWALAASFSLFGATPFAALLPSLLGFGIAVVGTSVAARVWVGASAWPIAGLAVAVAPPLAVFAATAMAELPYLAACATALALFSLLPERVRPWLGPLLLVLPFLFRELGAFYAAPFAAAIALSTAGGVGRRWRAALAFSGLSVGLLGALYRLPALSSKPTLLLQNLFAPTGDAKYADAFAVDGIAPDAGAWLQALLERVGQNVSELGRVLLSDPFGLEALSIHLMLWPVVLSLIGWVRLPAHRRVFAMHVAIVVPTLAFIFLLYRWEGFIGMRQLLMTWPFAALSLAAWAREAAPSRHQALGAIAVATALSAVIVARAGNAVVAQADDQATVEAFLENVQPVRSATVVAPFPFGSVYLLSGLPATWSFVPHNVETLRLLDARFPIGTALLTDADIQRLGQGALAELGLVPMGMQAFGALRIVVFIDPTAGQP
jgi:4-amino-4-deoxy-L-arabinose transferase-like glycosyltransferase